MHVLSWRGSLAIAFSVVVLLLSSFVFVPPGNGYEYRMGRPFPLADRFHRHLSLPGRILVSQETPAEILATYVARDRADDASPRHTKGARLAGRDLRGANFTNAVLVNADLRGADLTGARLYGADLRGAQLTPAGASEALFQRPPSPEKWNEMLRIRQELSLMAPARLQGADLRYARLKNANLILADLRSARLEDARLEGADLTLADLLGARLDRAVLQGAELPRSRLDRASARDADLTAANLADASLVGVDFVRAKLYGADLSRTRSTRARFMQARLQGADFRDAVTTGADLRHAHLDGVRGILLSVVDLRGALLAGIDLCGEAAVPKPEITDFRDVDLSTPAPPDWEGLSSLLRASLEEGPLRQSALLRLGDRSGSTCLGTFDPRSLQNRKVLFDAEQRIGVLAGWPAPDITEREYQAAFAAALVKEACEDADLLQVLLTEVDSALTPADPALSVELARKFQDEFDSTAPESCPKLGLLDERRRQTLRTQAATDPFYIAPERRDVRSGD